MPTPPALPEDQYPQYADLMARARPHVGPYVDPHRVRHTLPDLVRRRGTDWCSRVLAKPWPGTASLSSLEVEALLIADREDLDPPTPPSVHRARLAAEATERARAEADQRRRDAQQDAWANVRDIARRHGVDLAGAANVHAGIRAGARVRLVHAVPTTAPAMSGSAARPRVHAAGRPLCETPTRARPLTLTDPDPDQLVTCRRCLTWAGLVRPS